MTQDEVLTGLIKVLVQIRDMYENKELRRVIECALEADFENALYKEYK